MIDHRGMSEMEVGGALKKLHALVRQPGETIQMGLSMSGSGKRLDYQRALEQHQSYVGRLRERGLTIVELPPLDDHPDACFVEDTAVVIGGRALLTRPGAASRRGEVDSIEEALSQFLEITRVQAPATLDGGDVMQVGGRIYVGQSHRSNAAGHQALAQFAAYDDTQVCSLPVLDALHLKSVASPVHDQLMVLLEGALDPTIFGEVDVVMVPRSEASAANVLALGNTVLIPPRCPLTANRLRDRELNVLETDTSEFALIDGALTCLSVLF